MEGLGELVFPSQCGFCGTTAHGQTIGLCDDCHGRLPVVGDDVCLRCGALQGPHVGTKTRCGQCPTDLGGIGRTVSLGDYATDGPQAVLREAILRLKFRHGLDAAPVLGRLMAEAIATRGIADDVDAIVPVPLHWRRQFSRGFNQAELLAEIIGAHLRIPVARLLCRRRHTPHQMQLPRPARTRNVQHAFDWPLSVKIEQIAVTTWQRVWRLQRPDEEARRGWLAGCRLLVVDDVMTTGATMAACARQLKSAGAEKLVAAVVARA